MNGEKAERTVPGWFVELQDGVLQEKEEKYKDAEAADVKTLVDGLKEQVGKLVASLEGGRGSELALRRTTHVGVYAVLIAIALRKAEQVRKAKTEPKLQPPLEEEPPEPEGKMDQAEGGQYPPMGSATEEAPKEEEEADESRTTKT